MIVVLFFKSTSADGVRSSDWSLDGCSSDLLVKQLVGAGTGMREVSDEVELNEQEKDILRLICEEYTNMEIAEKLFLSVRTVEGYRTRLFEKIGSRNVAGLVIFAIRQGIISI